MHSTVAGSDINTESRNLILTDYSHESGIGMKKSIYNKASNQNKNYKLSFTISAAFLAKFSSALSLLTISLVYIIGGSTSKLKFWPLTTISVYGSTLPAAYFFRSGFITTGICVTTLALSIRKHPYFEGNYILLLISGLCLALCASISCAENNNVHSTFAIIFFLLVGIFQLTVAFKLKQVTHRLVITRKLMHLSAFGGIYVVTEIFIVILMGLGLIPLPKKIILPSFEWSGVVVILSYLYYFGKVLAEQDDENSVKM